MSNLSKYGLIASVSKRTGVSRQVTRTVVDHVLRNILERLVDGDNVELRGFGVFEPRIAKARLGRDLVNNGRQVEIPERVVIKFKSGKRLKQMLQASLKENVQ
jgi:nucleoid DNA-binding protein